MEANRAAWTRRSLLAGAVAVGASGCSHARLRSADAVVGPGAFASVGAALDAAPAAATTPYRILVRSGRWREKLTVDKPNIHIVGEDGAGTVLDFDAAAGLRDPEGNAWGTSRSASLTIAAPGCALRNLTVTNSFDYVGARAYPENNPAGNGLQAVALAVARQADRTLIDNVTITGWQDTLLVNAGRSLFRNCRIEGAVDYIFGAGTAYFETCEILTRERPDMASARQGYITAPSTLLSTPYGLVFEACRLTRTPGLKPGSIALGRPWRPTATFEDGRYGNPEAVGQSVFLRCWMDEHIDPDGWDRMAFGAKGGGRGWTEPEEARFFEFESIGPGAVASPKRRRLATPVAARFSRSAVLGDWALLGDGKA